MSGAVRASRHVWATLHLTSGDVGLGHDRRRDRRPPDLAAPLVRRERRCPTARRVARQRADGQRLRPPSLRRDGGRGQVPAGPDRPDRVLRRRAVVPGRPRLSVCATADAGDAGRRSRGECRGMAPRWADAARRLGRGGPPVRGGVRPADGRTGGGAGGAAAAEPLLARLGPRWPRPVAGEAVPRGARPEPGARLRCRLRRPAPRLACVRRTCRMSWGMPISRLRTSAGVVAICGRSSTGTAWRGCRRRPSSEPPPVRSPAPRFRPSHRSTVQPLSSRPTSRPEGAGSRRRRSRSPGRPASGRPGTTRAVRRSSGRSRPPADRFANRRPNGCAEPGPSRAEHAQAPAGRPTSPDMSASGRSDCMSPADRLRRSGAATIPPSPSRGGTQLNPPGSEGSKGRQALPGA